MLPGISVVVPCLNQGLHLAGALDSLLRQEYPRLEVVVIDCGSTDNSIATILAYESRLTYWRSKADHGRGPTINEGMRHCSGDIVTWLDPDDYYLPDALWTVARARVAWPDRGLYIGNGFWQRPNDGSRAPFCRRHVTLRRDALMHGLDHVLQPATFFSRDAWDTVSGLDPSLRFSLDWDMVRRVADRYAAVLINEFLAVSRERPASSRLERELEIRRMVGRPMRPATSDVEDRVHLPISAVDIPRSPVRDTGRMPPISMVIPSLNQAAFLGQALDSIISQGYPHLEIIVFDAGSTDGSVELLRRYRDRLAYWASEPDRGPAHAINKGFARATAEILGWLNSDDMLASDALAEVGRAFAEDPELDIIYANALYVDERNHLYLADHGGYRTGFYYGEMQPRERIPRYWAYVHGVPQPTVFFRRRLLDACGPLDERYHFIFDFELFFRFAAKAKIRKLERTNAFYRIHARAKTSDWSEFLVELYRFSRPRWPDRRDPAFYLLWRDFLRGFARRHFGGRPRRPRQWVVLALAGLSALAKVGNPERLVAPGNRSRRSSPRPNALEPMPNAGAYTIRDRAPRYRSFFCSLILPRHPGHFGGEIRDFHLLRHLLKISTVEFFSVNRAPSDERTDWLGPFLEAVHAPDSLELGSRPLQRRVLRAVQRRHLPVLGPRYHDEVETQLEVIEPCRAALRQALSHQPPDFVFISPQVNPIALTLDTAGLRSRLVMASYDVEAERIESFAASSGGLRRVALRLEGRRARRFEEENLRAFDGIIAVSARDKDAFVGRYGFSSERVLVIENSVDPQYFAFAERCSLPAPHVVFVGTLSYLANREAAWRLVRDIMPLVRKRHQDARVWIVGQSPDPALLALSDGHRTVVTDRVEDVRPYLAQAAVACIPLTAGAGTKYKILEALSAGVPTVCTSVALKGLDLEDGEHLLVRDSNEDLATAIVTLIAQPQMATRLARRGRSLVERRYTWDANLVRLDDWLGLLASVPRRVDDRAIGR
jgi:glycosyltransferase involved in cell wall biosynthesis